MRHFVILTLCYSLVASVKPKAKVLFLHGYHLSLLKFYAESSYLRQELSQQGNLPVYLNGPITLTDSREDPLQSRGWWKHNYTSPEVDLKPGFETLRAYFDRGTIIPDTHLVQVPETEEERKLPIAAVVGFSQGALFAGLISYRFEQLFAKPPPQRYILFSGFKTKTDAGSGNARYDYLYPKQDDPSSSVRYLHVYGENDTGFGLRGLLSFYNIVKSNSQVLTHSGEHVVPNTRAFAMQVVNWLNK